MLQQLRERLVLVLIALLPFHAFLVTVATRVLGGTGSAPLTLLSVWKELLLGVILVIALFEWMRTERDEHDDVWVFDDTDVLIVGLFILGAVVSSLAQVSVRSVVFGIRYDFVALAAFFILRRVQWSEQFRPLALRVILGTGILVAAYGVLTWVLPTGFFTWLGYSDLHSLYVSDGPIAAFQHVEGLGIRRIQSTMSGPNHLGLWLLLPWSVALFTAFSCTPVWQKVVGFLSVRTGRNYVVNMLSACVIGCAILLTFSRTAWLSAFVIFVASLFLLQKRDAFKRSMVRLVTIIVGCTIIAAASQPKLLTRAMSTRDHLVMPLLAVDDILTHPLGQGLGSAGPATNRLSDTCVYLEDGADITWAADRPELCLFVGGQQVTPGSCTCPKLQENWYLQIGVEMGLAGFAIFFVITLFVLRGLFVRSRHKEIALAFSGVAFAALLLHAWEDSAVSYTLWILAASVLAYVHVEVSHNNKQEV